MTARPIRYQRQVSDRNGKIFYTSIASLPHISKYSSILCGPFLVWTHFCSGKTARTCQRWIFECFLAFETQAG